MEAKDLFADIQLTQAKVAGLQKKQNSNGNKINELKLDSDKAIDEKLKLMKEVEKADNSVLSASSLVEDCRQGVLNAEKSLEDALESLSNVKIARDKFTKEMIDGVDSKIDGLQKRTKTIETAIKNLSIEISQVEEGLSKKITSLSDLGYELNITNPKPRTTYL